MTPQAGPEIPDQGENQDIQSLKSQAGAYYKSQRDALNRELKNDLPRTKPLDVTTEFWVERLYDRLIHPLDVANTTYQEALKIIENSQLSEDQKARMANRKYESYKKEIDLAVTNAKAFVASLKQGSPDLYNEAIAKFENYAGIYVKLMTHKGGKLRDIFAGIIMASDVSDEEVKILDEAFLSDNPEYKDLAFFVLTMAKASVRETYAAKFIQEHPEKALAFIDRGNSFGCFSEFDVKKYLGTVSGNEKDPEAKAKADEKLKNWGTEEKAYKKAYENQKAILRDLQTSYENPDAKSGTGKLLTAKGIGKFIAYLCTIATFAANTIANRENLKHDKSKFFKNPYWLGSAVGFLALRQSSKGETLGDLVTGSSERDRVKNIHSLEALRDARNDNPDWDKELNGPLSDALGEYVLYMRTSKIPPSFATSEEFLTYCKKVDEQKGDGSTDAQKAFAKLKEGKTDSQFLKEIHQFCAVFDNLKIVDKDVYAAKVTESKDLS